MEVDKKYRKSSFSIESLLRHKPAKPFNRVQIEDSKSDEFGRENSIDYFHGIGENLVRVKFESDNNDYIEKSEETVKRELERNVQIDEARSPAQMQELHDRNVNLNLHQQNVIIHERQNKKICQEFHRQRMVNQEQRAKITDQDLSKRAIKQELHVKNNDQDVHRQKSVDQINHEDLYQQRIVNQENLIKHANRDFREQMIIGEEEQQTKNLNKDFEAKYISQKQEDRFYHNHQDKLNTQNVSPTMAYHHQQHHHQQQHPHQQQPHQQHLHQQHHHNAFSSQQSRDSMRHILSEEGEKLWWDKRGLMERRQLALATAPGLNPASRLVRLPGFVPRTSMPYFSWLLQHHHLQHRTPSESYFCAIIS